MLLLLLRRRLLLLWLLLLLGGDRGTIHNQAQVLNMHPMTANCLVLGVAAASGIIAHGASL
jgi:hypothetical protein